MGRSELVASMAKTLYEYAVAASNATWDGKRPGFSLPSIAPTSVKSCGGFRAWAIHAHDGGVCFSIDGFSVRAGRNYGGVGVIVGGGNFIFPIDDSRGNHSLRMSASSGSQIVNVTDADEVKWESRIAAMRDTLQAATEVINVAVKKYDLAKQLEREIARASELSAAASVLA